MAFEPWSFGSPSFDEDLLVVPFAWNDGQLAVNGRLGFRNVAERVECVSASIGEVVGLDGTAMRRVNWGRLIKAAKRYTGPWLVGLNPQAGAGLGRDMAIALSWLQTEKPKSVPILNREPSQGTRVDELLAGAPTAAATGGPGRPRLRDDELRPLALRREQLAAQHDNATARLIEEIQNEQGADAPSEKTIRAHLTEARKRGLLSEWSPRKPWSQNGASIGPARDD